MTTEKRGLLTASWDFFCSLKLSIFLLIGLAATSVIGTVIQQNLPIEEYYKEYSESTIRLFSTLGFFDMYHSWWFILLLYMLTLNLIACSVKRLPRVWKIVSEPTLVMDQALERTLQFSQEIKRAGKPNELKDQMKDFLATNFAAPVVTEQDGEVHLFAQKNAYSRLGVYVVHLSIIIIFIGAIIGSLFGYKAFVNIKEGDGTSRVFTRNEKTIDLGFTVRCEDFSVSFYDTGAPKEFKSILSVVDNGRTVIENRPIVVNDPLTYKGITFYQSSYGSAGDPLYYLSVRPKAGGIAQKITARQGEWVNVPGAQMRVVEGTQDVRQFMPAFSGPAARLEVRKAAGSPEIFTVFKNFPDFDAQRGGDLVFTFEGFDEKMYTGLQVAKDPGVWVVWAGCTLMVVGIGMAFFMSHKRIWIRISSGKIVIAGTSNKNQSGFDLLFHDLVDKLKSA